MQLFLQKNIKANKRLIKNKIFNIVGENLKSDLIKSFENFEEKNKIEGKESIFR